MLQIALRRILIGIPLVVGVSILVFLVLHLLPGDPVAAALAGAPVTPSVVHNLEVQYGLTRPVPTQYWQFVVSALHGNLGRAYTTNQTVTSLIGSQLGATVQLTVAALVLTIVFGIGGGVLAAMYKDRLIDHVMRVVSVFGSAMPLFWTGIVLIIVFSFTIHLFPSAGTGGISYLVLPAVSLAFLTSGLVVRLVRNSTIETLSQPYVRALKAKGLRQGVIVGRHVLRNALIPAVTVIGVQVGGLLSGAVITETVFARQGIGSLLVQAIEQKDYPVVQGLMLFISVVYVAVNIVVDICYAYLDPRIRTTLTQNGR
jgi:ABC-type dipeptide/oligopeptide/nickel transport system permease component